MSSLFIKRWLFHGISTILFFVISIFSIAQPTDLKVQVANADLGAASNSPANSNNGISTELILSSGSLDRVLLGATFAVTKDVSIKEFTITFSDNFEVLTSLKIIRSANAIADLQDKEAAATYSFDARSIRVVFTSPIDLATAPITFFLKANISNYASVNSSPIIPSLALSSIVLTQGTVAGANITGRSYSFKDVTPPQVVSLSPINGSANVTVADYLTIQFDEAVALLDGKISVYTFDRKKVIELPVIPNEPTYRKVFSFAFNGLLTSNNNYYVVIAPGSNQSKTGFVDNTSPGNGFPGFSKITEWAFMLPEPSAPKFVTTSAAAKNPDLKNSIVDITPGGATIQTALNKPGKVSFFVTTSPSVKPTVSQILDPSLYTGTVITSDYFSVDQDSVLQYAPLIGDLTIGITYDVWLAATSTAGVTMQDEDISSISFIASAPANGPYKPLIVSGPVNYKICKGDYQRIAYPITISETNTGDFASKLDTSGKPIVQTFNLLLPTGYEFDISATSTSVLKGGADIKIESFSFVGTTVLKVGFSVSATATRDRIIINGLKIKATSSVGSGGNLIRLGGDALLAAIVDYGALGSVKTVSIPAVTFDIYDASTNLPITGSIPTSIAKASLRPHISLLDYGINTFSGDGVNGDEFSPLAAGVGQHSVSFTYKDQYGCTVDTSRVITVYDFTKAVNGLDTLYNINQGPKVTISKSGKGSNYRLESVTASSTSDLGIDPKKCLSEPDAAGNVVFDVRVFNINKNKTKPGGTGARLATLWVVGMYRNLTTSLLEEFTQKIGIYAPPNPLITSGVANGVVCEDAGNIQLQAIPQTSGDLVGFFTLDGTKPTVGSALVDPADGSGKGFLNATILANTDNLAKNKLSFVTHQIRYIVQNSKTKGADTTVLTVKLSAKPKASFSTGLPCVGPELVTFTNTSTEPGNGGLSSFWEFGDDKATTDATSVLTNPTHKFTDPKSYQVSLKVTSALGCVSTTNTQVIKVSDLPSVNFSFRGVSVVDDISFRDASTITNDNIQNRTWDFGDQTSLINTNTTSLTHKFSKAGTYYVKLKITGSVGCTKTKAVVVGILPKDTILETGLYEQKFEDGSDGWQTLRSPFNGKEISSWKKISSSPLINSTTTVDNGKIIWKTNNSNLSYDQNETSYLYSPSFDFSKLPRPSIEFNILTDLLTDNDGVVVQYSTDNRNIADSLKAWSPAGSTIDGNTLGFYSSLVKSGSNWYNSEVLQGKPGENAKGYGWSGKSTSNNMLTWQEARHSLENIDPSKRSQVVFRFALGSTNKLPKENGFALDNVRIGSRTRTVLIENFTNAGNTLTVASRGNIEKAENNFLKDSLLYNTNYTIGTDIVKLSYHVNFPANDPFNLDNPQEMGARALYYNISKTPLVRLDGLDNPDTEKQRDQLFSLWSNEFKLQTLKLALADIKLSAIVIDSASSKANGAIRISATITSRTETLPKDITVLQLAVVEPSIKTTALKPAQQGLIKTGETNFEYVVKKLVPSASGTPLPSDLKLGKFNTFSFDWKPDLAKFYSAGKPTINIVAFLQNSITKEVYQSALISGITYQLTITGLEALAEESIELYPNPAKNQFTIEFPAFLDESLEVNLIDPLGKSTIAKYIKLGEKSIVVNTEHFSTGMYIVQLLSKEGKVVHKKIMIVGE